MLRWLFNPEDPPALRRAKMTSLVALLMGGALIGSVVVGRSPAPDVAQRRDRKPAPAKSTPSTASSSLRMAAAAPGATGAAFHDAALSGLISNYVMAVSRNDELTQQAMLNALRRQPHRARELLYERRKMSDVGTCSFIVTA